MYDELVERLHQRIALTHAGSPLQDDLQEAADAIEKLGDWWAMADKLVKMLKMPRWIPVTERLPDMHMVHSEYGCGDYMISDAVAIYAIDLGETPEVFCGIYEKDLGEDGFEGWTDCGGNPFNTVTHWMPLPEHPKEE